MRATVERLANCAAARRFTRYLRCDRATTAIEFAFVSPIIIAILLATLQVVVIFLAQSYLEAVAEKGMRAVLTNQTASMTQAQFKAAICPSNTALFNCSNLMVNIQQYDPVNYPPPDPANPLSPYLPHYDSHGNLVSPSNYNVTNLSAQAKMIMVVSYQWPVISGPLGLNFGSAGGNGTFLMVSTHVFQIEPTS